MPGGQASVHLEVVGTKQACTITGARAIARTETAALYSAVRRERGLETSALFNEGSTLGLTAPAIKPASEQLRLRGCRLGRTARHTGLI